MIVKEFTRHNDKLGFDHSIPNNGYYVSYSPQFTESAYGGESGFLAKAVSFYTEKNLTQEAEHFKKMKAQYNMPANKGASRTFQMPDNVLDERMI